MTHFFFGTFTAGFLPGTIAEVGGKGRTFESREAFEAERRGRAYTWLEYIPGDGDGDGAAKVVQVGPRAGQAAE